MLVAVLVRRYALRGRNPTSSGFTLDRIAETVGLQDRLAARTPATPTVRQTVPSLVVVVAFRWPA